MSLTDSEKNKTYTNKINKNVKVAKLDKKKLNIIRQSGQKAGDKFSIHKLLNKKAKVIPINIGLKKKK